MVKLFRRVLLCEGQNRWMTKEWGMGKLLNTIRDSCYHKVKGAVIGGGGRYDNPPTAKIYTTLAWARILSDRNVFYTLRGG